MWKMSPLKGIFFPPESLACSEMVALSKPTKGKEEWYFNMVTTVKSREKLTNSLKDLTQRD
jgi:hypothetical protein